MKIIFIGDIVGRSGRDALAKYIPLIKNDFEPDAIIVNSENAAAGYGLTKKIAEEIFSLGVDVITLGNHAWDQREMLSYIEEKNNIIRPANYPKTVPGKGEINIQLKNGKNILVIQIMLRLFMNMALDDPFSCADKILQSNSLGKSTNAILIDMHGEASSEKQSFGHFVDGRVTAVLGTHTHIPTADGRILSNKTAYQTDVGMTGDYNSVIGFQKEGPVYQFVHGYRQEGRFKVAEKEAILCGTFVESDDETGLAKKIVMIHYGNKPSFYGNLP
ncbi:MAG: hypothetical protein CFH21_00640 [Alphaproteobacteria bacterium MarineAlpha5_Bin11]|nr:TIGR00282 family metallophosphoesterase [Pelagibacteraceae bacterium]PPR43844.1 MAG: hypothetical protein CFH21_00640 [Alphaproteobacteria bacterium MarineAlpha5_Bin11]|tara:strand:+ start:13645 stop:14466 length:822 start_codon:yes stop_codon:yes gene_type:complete